MTKNAFPIDTYICTETSFYKWQYKGWDQRNGEHKLLIIYPKKLFGLPDITSTPLER